ncbi:Type 1 glutamine amidotransferase-like domain-containing protein [Chitinophaga sp. GCM10012297]|uniref:Type 1 glutamine amidotransferase-like domain-containing protein n=1 Tax=Chitinophaga chungangae TaxID=2821488 RepID=A0ABS3YGI7_9BACT|nr:Type 1 glutamine amidotransferase-like domain-containing protein [Chitinophaga chungangae]MBO9153786.1 Type 1 glutamine amidotransferase-like domain-containing protein [Chitinophaga chungangae]
MSRQYKLLLYSLGINDRQLNALNRLVGKEPSAIKLACIENAADVIPQSEGWVKAVRQTFSRKGYQVEPIDLRLFRNRRQQLRDKLSGKDVIWLGGGNTFYLRWILRASGADDIIRTLVSQGKVFSGWSAGAIVAGPTIEYFDSMDDPDDAPEVILEGLNLTNIIVIPHIDNADFIQGAHQANMALQAAGYHTLPLGDEEVLVISGDDQRIIE